MIKKLNVQQAKKKPERPEECPLDFGLQEEVKMLGRDYLETIRILTRDEQNWQPDKLALVLRAIVGECGKRIYQDPDTLSAKLREKEVRPAQAKAVELAVAGSSLTRYLDQLNKGLTVMDINNIILSVETAGLSSAAARQIVASILYSLNVPQLPKDILSFDPLQPSDGHLYIPPQVYEERLHMIADAVRSGAEITESQFRDLNSFASAGIPGAYTLLGRMYMLGMSVPADREKGRKYLQYAASHGDPEACALLGDLAYEWDNEQAYRMYTKPGALAVGKGRWEKLRRLERSKRFNRAYLLLMLLVAAIVEGVMLLTVYSPLSGAHGTALVVCSILNLAAVILAAMVHIRNPFRDLRNYSLPVLLVFVLYIFILI